MLIQKATLSQIPEILGVYNDIIAEVKDNLYRPDWYRDLYPNLNHILSAVENGTMYVGLKKGKIVAVMVLNQEHNDSYNQARWQKNLLDDEILVLHLLGVHPDFMKQGIASEMVEFAKKEAARQGKKAVRLDVFNRNLHAEQLYLKHGFQLVDTVRQRYKETNWKYSNLFEFLLEPENDGK